MLIWVAPRAGAWIETFWEHYKSDLKDVAPRAGAWIETKKCKLNSTEKCVAPRAGAWIETRKSCLESKKPKSPLAQGRGLKLSSSGQ